MKTSQLLFLAITTSHDRGHTNKNINSVHIDTDRLIDWIKI